MEVAGIEPASFNSERITLYERRHLRMSSVQHGKRYNPTFTAATLVNRVSGNPGRTVV